jgi:heat shock protein HslJ
MKRLFAIVISGLLLVGCNGNKATTKNSTAPETATEAGVKNYALEDTYWILTELNGNQVSGPKDGEKPSFIYFSSAKKRVSVSGGCNVMSGSYDKKEGNQIVFGQMISTLMACPDMTNEEGLKKMTGMVDNYAIQGDNLSFAKARMAPVARFKAAPVPAGMKLE